jgi:hypothetical protein
VRQCSKSLWGTRIVLETVQCDQNVGNAEIDGAECQGTIHWEALVQEIA